MDKASVIAELKRVAEVLQTDSISRSMFAEYGMISSAAAEQTFGSWNEAIKEAGLVPLPPGSLPKSETKRRHRLSLEHNTQSLIQPISDEDALRDLVRLTKELGRRPSTNHVSAKGRFSSGVYSKRWGSVASACETAYAKYGNPLDTP